MFVKNLLFFLFILLILVASCKKGPAKFSLTGTISDETFSTTLNNCNISLYKYAVGSAHKTLISTITSYNGSYKFDFDRDKSEKYELVVLKENYFDISKVIYFSEFTANETLQKDYSTTAKAWAKLTFINQNPLIDDPWILDKPSAKQLVTTRICRISKFTQL